MTTNIPRILLSASMAAMCACSGGGVVADSTTDDLRPINFSAKASASAAQVSPGDEETISLEITSAHSSTVDVAVSAIQPDGTVVDTETWPGTQIAPKAPVDLSQTWQLEDTDPAGTWKINVTLYKPGTTTAVFSKSAIVSFQLLGTTSTPSPTPTPTPTPTPAPPGNGPVSGSCVFASSGATPAFCATFDAPSANKSSATRTGDLDPELWGVFRSGGGFNPSQGDIENWAAVQIETCNGSQSVYAPNDVIICNGQLREAVNDNGGVSSLTIYPKQPFDFAGRTGNIVFDVSNNTQGGHAAWPELWVTDKPIPGPFIHQETWKAIPQNGFGLRFAGCTNENGDAATCPRGDGTDGVWSVEVVRNYVPSDSDGPTANGLIIQGHDSVVAATGPGQMNHYEVQVSQNQIEVYGTDAYSGALDFSKTPLRHIATVPNANLTFTKGLVWMGDGHYNGNKFNTQRTNTFAWDNFGFDGPKTYRDLAFDVADANILNGDGTEQLGYQLVPGSTRVLSVAPVYRKQTPTGALVTFQWNANDLNVPSFRINNGPWHDATSPFPDQLTFTPRSIAVSIPVSEVPDGSNTIEFKNATNTDVHNVDVILVAAEAVP